MFSLKFSEIASGSVLLASVGRTGSENCPLGFLGLAGMVVVVVVVVVAVAVVVEVVVVAVVVVVVDVVVVVVVVVVFCIIIILDMRILVYKTCIVWAGILLQFIRK
jgi:hypothetical protein